MTLAGPLPFALGSGPQAGGSNTLNPAHGALSITGQTVTLHISVTPTAGALVIAGKPAALKSTRSPASGALLIAGATPVVTNLAHGTLAPGHGTLTIAGQQARFKRVIPAQAGALVVAGLQASLKRSVGPLHGSLVIAGQPVQLASSLTKAPASGHLSLGGGPPGVILVISPAGFLPGSGGVPGQFISSDVAQPVGFLPIGSGTPAQFR